GVVSEFRLSHAEIEKWLLNKTPLSNYLGSYTVKEAEGYAHGRPWTRIIWDVCAVAWLFNENDRFMRSREEKVLLCDYNGFYEKESLEYTMKYVYSINRDELMYDLIRKITEE
ncbi:MAG: nucleoside hydrolase, partial [Clostridia bacterium]|nr:nucleoside hydrolase [Clostridia bacterium]